MIPAPPPQLDPNQQPGPSQQLPPLAQSLVAGTLPPPQALPAMGQGQDPQSSIYTVDPEVFDRPVRINIDGSSRMITRDILSQTVQFIAPFIGNGPFMQQLQASGYTVDFPTFFKMLQDATGTKRMYHWIRPLNPQEQQRLDAPPPQVVAAQQKSQLDSQTRLQIMDMKVKADTANSDKQAQLKELEIQEASARHILTTIQAERQALQQGQGDAQKAALDAKIKAQQAQQDLTHKAQAHQLDMSAQQQKLGLDFQAQRAQHALDLRQQFQQHLMDTSQQSSQHGLDMQHAQHDHALKHAIEIAKAKQVLSMGAAKAKAARMMPKPQPKAPLNSPAVRH